MPPVLARRPRRPRHYRWDAAHAGRHPLHRRYNLGKGVRDKFTNLSKIGFSIECFTADFLRFFTKKRQKVALGCTCHQIQAFPEFSSNFLISQILGLTSFGNSCGNSYIHILLMII